MAGQKTLAPLSDTIRVVEWDELPATVREIPEGFDPRADGVLMKHQFDWIRLDAAIKGAEKGRRTGITFAEALDDTITAGSRKSAGGDNVFYIGDTREKGLEFIGYCAKFARVIAEAQGQGVSNIEEFLFADQDADGNTKQINAYRIRFASGFAIVALSSRPANIRGLQGIVVIDEAAFHVDVQAVLDAATALLIWGGKIRVISTHNSKRNAFYTFIRDIADGRYGKDAKVFRCTFDDAVANGLYERACFKRGEKPTVDGKRDWYERIRSAYGPRKAAMREELDAIPRDGGGKSVPGVWIERAMREERPVLRLVLDDDFARLQPAEREAWVDGWIAEHLALLLVQLDPALRHVAGMDYARHRDFSVIKPAAIAHDLRRVVPFIVEMSNVPTAQQQQILWAVLRALPLFSGAAIDATGSGQTLAEYTADEFGLELVHQVTLNRAWYGEWMPKMIDGFQDGTYDLPKDAVIADDYRAIEEIDGVPMVPKLSAKDLKDPNLVRHGDSAIAGVLMWFASLNMASPLESQSVGRRASVGGEQSLRRGARGFGSVGGGTNWRGW
jgi:phage FluMu gp28-like protein